jgi:hypothetical protein
MGPIQFGFLFSIILFFFGLYFPLRANAHGVVGPPLPLHHAALAVRTLSLHPVVHMQPSSINSLLSSFLSKGLQNRFRGALFSASYVGIHVPVSITSRNLIQSERVIVAENINAGKASVETGGTITGGNLEGDFYIKTSGNNYVNLGEYQYALTGSGPGTGIITPGNNFTTSGFVNTINFANGSFSGSAINYIHPSTGNIFYLPISFSRKSFLASRALLATTAYSFGQRSVQSSVLLGGQLYGSFYGGIGGANPQFGAAGMAIFAFGNSPLNNPSSRNGVLSLANPSTFLTYTSKTFFPYSGQLAGTFTYNSPYSPIAALFASGSNSNNMGSFTNILRMPQLNFLDF